MSDPAPEPPAFAALWDSIVFYEGRELWRDMLVPWLDETGDQARVWLEAFGRRRGDPIPSASDDDLFDLYALSRVVDALLFNFQPGIAGDPRADVQVVLAASDYVRFMTAIGGRTVQAPAFSPFFHEIVTVDQTVDRKAQIELAGELWPAVMAGDLMIARAGVTVSGGRDHIDKQIAETSTLYWAYQRRNRPRNDLSLGWGFNSGWATAFRRDYLIDGGFHFNVDGKTDLRSPPEAPDRDGLTPPERLELLVNRCFITAGKPHNDLWPFDDRIGLDAG
jgi:hypothetical protein